MFERILKEFRDKIRRSHYIITLHADEEMNFDNFGIFDLEHCVLTGKIIERQIDSTTS